MPLADQRARDDDPYESFRILGERRRTAAKTHVCCACKRHIQAGSRYLTTATLSDGAFLAFRAHLDPRECWAPPWSDEAPEGSPGAR